MNTRIHRIAAATSAAAILCCAAGTAAAAPVQAGCTAADLAQVSAAVATDTHAYLLANPDVNEFFTGIEAAQGPDVQQQVQSYMDSHPQVHADLQRIRQPRTDLLNRCGWASGVLGD